MNQLSTPAENQIDDTHYLKSVTQLGDVQPIVASRDIHASTGMKLISAGVHINSSLYDRLLKHKLVPDLDQCVSIENTVTGVSLAKTASRILQENKSLALIQSAHYFGQSLTDILKQVQLNSAIAFKLTVMREMQPELFQHSIIVALVSTYTGLHLHMQKHQLIDLATAALLHDIGMLHMDPQLLEPAHEMTETERHHLYVHTVTACMILKAYPEYQQKILDAILQHHERLDGSGYPKGLKDGEIGQFGRIVAVAEVVASRYGADTVEGAGTRLGTILKLNMRRYGKDIVSILKVLYQDEGEAPPCSDSDTQAARERMSRISAIFSAWEKVQDELDTNDPVCKYTNIRMLNLRMEIIDAGLNPSVEDLGLFGMETDSTTCFDVKILLDETSRQLRDIVQEIRRRWPLIDHDSSMSGYGKMDTWIQEAETL